jgi:hypothetical protein
MDLQTLTSPPSLVSGSYAFILSGVDGDNFAIAYGGVFSIPSSGTTLQNGLYDANDTYPDGGVTTGTTLSGTFTEPDSFGRGTIASSLPNWNPPGAAPLNYYVVGPEAIRIIEVQVEAQAVGSAFGQGTNATYASNASLGGPCPSNPAQMCSVFGIAGNPVVGGVGALGQFSTSNTGSNPADFSGVGDYNQQSEGGIRSAAALISGTYSIASNGYGSLTITAGDLGDYLSVLGIYMTDPNLNLNDPNNTTGGGGALVLDLDGGGEAGGLAGTTGVLIPQTDTATADFTGNYAVGAQDFNSFNPTNQFCPNPAYELCEFDLVGQGSVASLVLSGTALISDPELILTTNATDSVVFSGTPLADTNNPGRYTMSPGNNPPNPFQLFFNYGVPTRDLDLVIYQASGGQLFWLETDNNGVWLGTLQQQGPLTGMPAARKAAAKSKRKSNHSQ